MKIIPHMIKVILPLQLLKICSDPDDIASLTSSHRRPYKHVITFGTADRRASKHAFRFLCVLAGALLTRHTCRAIVALDLYTRNHFLESVGSRFGGPDKRHCQQWTSQLLCGFLPNPFIQDLFLWSTSQEFVKTDLYPLSLISLQYAVCSTRCWSIIGRCIGACQRSNWVEERQP